MSLIGISETASVLKIGKETLYRIIDEKNIKTLKIGKKIGFDNEQTKILKEAVTEYKTNQPFKKPKVRKDDYSRFNLYTLNAACQQLKIGRKRLFEHIGKLGITPSLHGSAKIITSKEFNRIKESLEEEILLLSKENNELYDGEKKLDSEKEDIQISNPVVKKAIETLKERSESEKPSLQAKQQSFNITKPVENREPPRDGKAYSSLVAKVTELTDENNALIQTLKERTEILDKKKEELRKLSGEMNYLRNQYKELRSYKDDMEVLLKNVRNAFQFLYKL